MAPRCGCARRGQRTRPPSRRSSTPSRPRAATCASTASGAPTSWRATTPTPTATPAMALLAHLDERVVAVAGYDRLNEPGAAEVAFAVADEMQGRGLATRLLEQLAEIAAERGITRFDAEVMADNRAMLGVFAGAGFDTRRETDFGEVHLVARPAPDRALRGAHRPTARTWPPSPRCARCWRRASVAVVGASAREGSVGGAIFRADRRRRLRRRRRAGAPRRRRRRRRPARRARSSDLDEPPELAVVAVPAAEVLGVVRRGRRAAGARGVLVVSTGFSDTDEPEGRAREEALLEAVRAHGLRLVGPNALGLVNTDPAVGLHALHRRGRRAPRRPGAVVAVGRARPGAARPRRRAAAWASRPSSPSATAPTSRPTTSSSTGPTTRARAVVALYMESFGNPRRFSQVSRRVSRRKPILAVKGGRAGASLDEPRSTRRALPPGRRAARRDHRRRCSTPPSCSSASRCRAGAGSAW